MSNQITVIMKTSKRETARKQEIRLRKHLNADALHRVGDERAPSSLLSRIPFQFADQVIEKIPLPVRNW